MKKVLLFTLLISLLPLVALFKTDASWLWLLTTLLLSHSLVSLNNVFQKVAYKFIVIVGATICIHIVNLAFFISYVLQNEGFNTAFFYHLKPDVYLGAINDFKLLILFELIHCAALLWTTLAIVKQSHSHTYSNKQTILLSVYSLVVLSFWAPLISLYNYSSTHLVENKVDNSSAEQILKKIHDKELSFSGEHKKNLVIIYMEGVEKTFYELPDHPNLMPQLTKIKHDSIDFTNMIQVAGNNYTMGGIVASQCALPLISPYQSSDHNASAPSKSFMVSATCLSDVLHEKGYSQSYFGGADLRFASKGKFFKSHHYDSIQGKVELTKNLKNKKDMQSWGLWDDDLFSMATDEFFRLAKQERPFALTMLTVDTHPPHGNKSKSCSTYQASSNKMLISAHCADQLVGQYIDTIRASEYSEDTVIAVISDHLMMHSDASSLIRKSKLPRRLTFFINYHDGRNATHTHKGTHFDIPATLMDALDYQQEGQFGFGQSLLKQPGFLFSEANTLDVVNNTRLKDYVKSLWVDEILKLDEKGIQLTRITNHKNGNNGHNLTIGKNQFNLTYQGIWDTAETLIRFDPETLEVLEYQTHFGNHNNLTPMGLARLAFKFPYDNYILIGRNKYLSGLVDSKIKHKLSIFIGSPSSNNNYVADIHKKPLNVSYKEIMDAFSAKKSEENLLANKKNVFSAQYISQEEYLKEWFSGSEHSFNIRACGYGKCRSTLVDSDKNTHKVTRGLSVFSLDSSFKSEFIENLDYCRNSNAFEKSQSLLDIAQQHKELAKYLVLVSYDSIHCDSRNKKPMKGLSKWTEGLDLPKLKRVKFREPYLSLINIETQKVVEVMSVYGKNSPIKLQISNGEVSTLGK